MNQTPTPQQGQQPRGGQGGRGGMHMQRRRPKTRYGTQMAEKQQLKEIFGIREGQLYRYYQEARKVRAATGGHLISLLERRLDNAVFRAGFAPTRPTARQMVSHGFLTVNEKPVTVASFRVSPDDIVTIKPSKRKKSHFANFPKGLQNVRAPEWIELQPDSFSFKITALPQPEEAGLGVDIQAIVEFFAR